MSFQCWGGRDESVRDRDSKPNQNKYNRCDQMAPQAKALITRDLNLSSIPRLHNPDLIKLPSDLLTTIHAL